MTGGASGIGADIVRAFAANRARVAFVDILEAEGKKVANDTGSLFLKADITDIPALQSRIGEVESSLGPIGVLVNNAANDDRHKVEDVTVDYWERTQAVNLRHHFFAAQAVRPQMQKLGGGAIVNFSSIAWRGGGDMPVYAAAKAAVLGLTRSLARDFGRDNIRVNAIEPGAVITERQKRLWYTEQSQIDGVVERQAIQRLLLGDEIARLVLFLASDDSRMITRQSVVIDAGLS